MIRNTNIFSNNLSHRAYLPKSIFTFLCLLTFVITANAQEKYIDSIKARIYNDLQNDSRGKPQDEMITGANRLLTGNDSCWSDVDYKSADPKHLGRVLLYAKAFTNPRSIWYHNDRVYNCIAKTLSYWYKTKRVNWNWYNNDIGAPINTGQILILMDGGGKPLPASLTQYLLGCMARGAAVNLNRLNGANQADIAKHYLYRGCLTRDPLVIDSAARYSLGKIDYVDHLEGIQHDNSFQAHGPQEAIASYGSVYVDDLYNMAYYLHDTPFVPKGKGLAILSDFYLNTYLASIRNGYFDFDVLGRGVSRVGSLKAGHQSLLAKRIPLVDPANAKNWEKANSLANGGVAADDLITPKHTQFWISDYVQHIRPLYSFNVRMSSVRTSRTEAGNKENMLGNFLADGSTNIQRRGDEYFNIMPVWEWDKIPGTTVADLPGDASAKIPKEWGIRGFTSFVGGVSNAMYGASAYDMQSNGVNAKKAWFFFDKEVVFLGAGITSTDNQALITNINQCWLKGEVMVGSTRGLTTIKQGRHQEVDHPQWLLHDSIGYFFPTDQHLQVSAVTQTGSWQRIRAGSTATPVSGTVFKAWLEHKKADDTYAYIVVPGLADEKAMQAYDQQQIEILANTDSVQAVMNRQLDMLQVVLYKAEKIKLGDVTVDARQPCIIMLTGVHTHNRQLYLADPTQTSPIVKVDLLFPDDSIVPFRVNMPTGVFAGSTVGFEFDKTGSRRLPDIRNGAVVKAQ